MNPGSSEPSHRKQDGGAGAGYEIVQIVVEEGDRFGFVVAESRLIGATNDGSSTPSMLVPQDQQTRKPASTVSPHLEQIQDGLADLSEGGDKGSRNPDAGAVSWADSVSVTSSAGANVPVGFRKPD